MSEQEFCPLCDVSLDLHDGPDTCALAAARARLVEIFDRMIGAR
jgi:hypothetical protein